MSLRLCEWLDDGAPGYPDGEAKARRIWARVLKLEHMERATTETPVADLVLVPDDDHDGDWDDQPAWQRRKRR